MTKTICSRFNNSLFHEIDFTVYGLQRDHPPAWKLVLGQQAPAFQIRETERRATIY